MGYTLDEIPNDITKETPACFEPTIDYVVVKTPRWAFEKFPLADARLTTHMKSVGENMAIGRTFKEAFQKSMRSRELDVRPVVPDDDDALVRPDQRPLGRALRPRSWRPTGAASAWNGSSALPSSTSGSWRSSARSWRRRIA